MIIFELNSLETKYSWVMHFYLLSQYLLIVIFRFTFIVITDVFGFLFFYCDKIITYKIYHLNHFKVYKLLHLVNPQCCAAIMTINFQNIFITSKENPHPLGTYSNHPIATAPVWCGVHAQSC